VGPVRRRTRACGTLTVRRPLVPRGWKAHLGIWSIRFDSGPGRTPMLNRLGASFLICNRHLAQMLSDCPRPLGTAG
jgi:hypothetical protein